MASGSTLLAPRWEIFGNPGNMQDGFDVAVVMPTVGRVEVLHAIQSVYAQRHVGRIQLLIGVDQPVDAMSDVLRLLSAVPSHVTACLFYPGYSTSIRHGGLYTAKDGGALRCTLTHLANAEHVAYLDDDNWWEDDHLASLLTAIKGHEWAYSLRWFIHPLSRQRICVDEWESVGPGKGIFQLGFGGFVDTNCLMINKMACWKCVALWNISMLGDEKGMSADRNVFNLLSKQSIPGETNKPSVNYVLDPNDVMHPIRMEKIGEKYNLSANIVNNAM